jgi:glycogen(starch) synthase
MRVLMLSWEYPPRAVGGLARHVYELTRSLVKKGVQVELLTAREEGLPYEEEMEEVRVFRVDPYHGDPGGFTAWVMRLNLALLEKGAFLASMQQYDLVHAHDWLVAYAARGLKHAFQLPLLATIHATEHGRNQGLHNDLQRYISDVEWWLTFEAWKVICCSRYMEEELMNVFQLPRDKISIIYNGIQLKAFQPPPEAERKREQFARPEERIIFFVGRLVREKGVHILLEAAAQLKSYEQPLKFIIAGKGPEGDYLRQKAWEMGLQGRVVFTGYINDEERNLLYHLADAAVFPSLYEPFGIVALEAMAAQTPVLVSDIGGFDEIVEHNVDGLKFYAGDTSSLASQLVRLFQEEGLAQSLRCQGLKKARSFSWGKIASQTIDVYRDIVHSQEKIRSQEIIFSRGEKMPLVPPSRYR